MFLKTWTDAADQTIDKTCIGFYPHNITPRPFNFKMFLMSLSWSDMRKWGNFQSQESKSEDRTNAH